MATVKRGRESSPTGATDQSKRPRLDESADAIEEDASPCHAHASCLPTRSIVDAAGDLTLIVGNTKCQQGATKPVPDDQKPLSFNVSAKILCQASSVFNKLLCGGSTELQRPGTSEEWIVRFPKDNPRAMSTLLNIMHTHFDKVLPTNEVTIEALYNITVLTDKYNVDHLLRPWAFQGMGVVRKKSKVEKKGCQRRLWIAWVLGDSASFEKDLATIMYKCPPTPLTKDSASYNIHFYALEPPGVTEIIKKHRVDAFRNVFGPLRESVEAMMNGTRPSAKGLGCLKREEKPDNDCNASLLGSLVRSLTKVKLWPLPQEDQIHHSPDPLSSHIELLRTLELTPHLLHEKSCSYHLRSFGGLQLPWAPQLHKLDATKEQRRHMAAQAKKTGVLCS